MIQVDTKRPVKIDLPEEVPLAVKNIGSSTAYYKKEPLGSTVSPTVKDGEIAANASLVITQPLWVIAKEAGALLRATEVTSPVRNWARAREPDEFYVTQIPFNVQNDGTTDDTVALQSAVYAATNTKAVIPPGLGCKITSPIEVPESSVLSGVNTINSRINPVGNIDALRIMGSFGRVEKLTFKAPPAPQASGSAIDFSHAANADSVALNDIYIGSNFFKGIVAYTLGVEMGDIKLTKVRFNDVGSRVKSYGGPAIVLGNTSHRCVTPILEDVQILGNATTDIPIGIEINNSDTVLMKNVLLQTMTKGLVVGNNDSSSLLTTNLDLQGVVADTCSTLGFELQKTLVGEMAGCHAQTCGAGLVLLSGVTGLSVTGGAYYHNQGHGIQIAGSHVPKTSSTIINGCQIVSNGENAEAGRAGIFIEEKAGGIMIVNNTIGNPEGFYGGKQKIGITLGKKSESIGIYGNRFHLNGTEPIKKEGEEVNINGKNAPSLVELETVNIKTT